MTKTKPKTIKVLTPEELGAVVARDFPRDATCWSKATDEVRDLCRAARELAGAPEEAAVNFRDMTSPSQWNSEGIDGIVKFYSMLSPEKRLEFCTDWEPFLRPSDVVEANLHPFKVEVMFDNDEDEGGPFHIPKGVWQGFAKDKEEAEMLAHDACWYTALDVAGCWAVYKTEQLPPGTLQAAPPAPSH